MLLVACMYLRWIDWIISHVVISSDSVIGKISAPWPAMHSKHYLHY